MEWSGSVDDTLRSSGANYSRLTGLFAAYVRIGGLAGWRVGGLAGWRVGGLAGWRTGGLADWRTGGGLAGWRTGGRVRAVAVAVALASQLRRWAPGLGR